jgi:hypothetical protein
MRRDVRLLVIGALSAVLLSACGTNGSTTAQQRSVSDQPTSERSPIPLADAVARLQATVRGIAAAGLPDGQWTEQPADSEGGPATDVCDDERGRPTDYRIVPYSMIGRFDSGPDPAATRALLDRVQVYLWSQGYSPKRATPVGSAGRVAGSKDGFFVALTIPANATQPVVEGTTPCVH